MALFYQGEKNPTEDVIRADVFQIVRYGTDSQKVIQELREHFKGNVTDEQLAKAITSLM